MDNFMFKTCLLIVTFFQYSCFERDPLKILTYEYGNHTDGEIVSFVYTGVIPAFEPHYTLNVKPTMPVLNDTFTYLRVQYINSFSQVTIGYNQNNSILNFYIKYPFMDFAFGVDGYSLPLTT